MAGFYTLANTAIELVALPPARTQKLSRYPRAPATLLGRLAVALRHQQRGLGEFLLLDAMHRTLEASRVTASFALVVDAQDDRAKAWDQRYSFEPIMGAGLRLVLPMQDLERNLG